MLTHGVAQLHRLRDPRDGQRQPRSGYEIKATVDGTTRFFWAASYGQIYPELKRLAEAGLIVGSDAPRGERKRTVYEITADGEEELKDWLRQAPATYEMREEGLLKLFFAGGLPRQESVEISALDARAPRGVAERLRADGAAGRRGSDVAGDPFPLMVLRGGIEFNEWFADWCERMRGAAARAGRSGRETLMFDALARLADRRAAGRPARDRLLPPRRRARRLGRLAPRPLRRRRPGDRDGEGEGTARGSRPAASRGDRRRRERAGRLRRRPAGGWRRSRASSAAAATSPRSAATTTPTPPPSSPATAARPTSRSR